MIAAETCVIAVAGVVTRKNMTPTMENTLAPMIWATRDVWETAERTYEITSAATVTVAPAIVIAIVLVQFDRLMRTMKRQ